MPPCSSRLQLLFMLSFVFLLLAVASDSEFIAASGANAWTQDPLAKATPQVGQAKEDAKQETEKADDAVHRNLGTHYGFLLTNRVATMEKELNAAGSAGYRAVSAGIAGPVSGFIFGMSGQALGFLLEKSETHETYQYRVWGDPGSISLEGIGKKFAKKLQDRLNAEAAAGFRIAPACMFSRLATTFMVYGGGNNTICMLKQTSLSSPGQLYEYQVVHDGGLKNLHEKIAPLLQQDYAVVALDEATADFAILERPANGGAPPAAAPNHAQSYITLTTNRVSSMLKDLNEKAKAGYRFRDAVFAGNAHRVILQLENNPKGSYEYATISFGDKELERKIEENGKRGFRLCLRTLSTDLIMEKAPGSDWQYHYNIAYGKELPEVFAKIDEAKQKGFTLLGLVGGGILLEMAEPSTAQTPAGTTP